MTLLFRLEVPGVPVAKGRPRFAVVGGHGRAYTPAKTRNYEQQIYALAVAQGIKPVERDRPVRVAVVVFVAPPKSLRVKVRRQIEAGCDDYPVVTRPDLDNYEKCLDALNGVAWADDAQICEKASGKYYSARPRVVITAWAKEGA